MRKYICISILLCLWMQVCGQEKERLEQFMEEYFSMWDTSKNNKPIPPFQLKTPEGDVIDSRELKGKVVVLDFWSTWCGPCRQLTHEMDSLLSNYYGKDFQMIGVNFQESIRKGDPVKYWKESGYRFPMTVDSDAYGKSVDAGNPVVIVVDQNGIVRGKSHGWTSCRAEEIELLVWLLLEKPEISLQAAVDELRAKKYVRALYLCDAVAAKNASEGKELAPVKLRALLHVDEWKALEFAKALRVDSKDSERMLTENGIAIAETAVVTPAVNALGVEVFEVLIKQYNLGDDLIVYDLMGRCYSRMGKKEKALRAAKKSLELARQQKASGETLKYLEGVLQSYNE